VEERFREAKAMFDDEDYLDAINEFTIITLQHQGSAYSDSAQFFLAECRFERGEYLVAATEYGYFRRSFPSSPLSPEAQYKLALSYYHLSPKPMLDQQYTKKALDEFQSYVEYYPTHAHATDAAAKIMELNTRLARKAYETARLYEIMEYYKASLFYYDDVIEKYHDTQYAPLAHLGKVEVLIERKKYEEALRELQKFYDLFPDSVLKSKADNFQEQIKKRLQGGSNVSGKAGGLLSSPSGQDLTQQQGGFR
jgi:outer membrane protein assembly factor BamD